MEKKLKKKEIKKPIIIRKASAIEKRKVMDEINELPIKYPNL